MSIIGVGPSRKVKVYTSARAASRELSGDGSDRRRSQIIKVSRNGGYIGSVNLSRTRRRSATKA